jgi:hypothetical protein
MMVLPVRKGFFPLLLSEKSENNFGKKTFFLFRGPPGKDKSCGVMWIRNRGPLPCNRKIEKEVNLT